MTFMNSVASSIRWVLKGKSGTAATLQTLMARLFIIAINVATGVITARSLGANGRGELAAMTLWPQFLAYTLTLGLPSAVIYNFKRHPEAESSLFSATLLLSSGLGVVASLVGVVFMPQWLSQYSPMVIQIAQGFMVTAPLALWSLTLTAMLEARGEFAIANHTRYLLPLSTLLLLAGLAAFRWLTPLSGGLAYILPSIPVTLYLVYCLWRRLHPTWQAIGQSCHRLLSYGIRSYGVDLMGTLSQQIGQVLVVGLLSPTSMGMYTVALSLSRMLNVFQSSIVTVLLPKAAARPIPEVIALTGRAARVSMTFTLMIAGAVMLLGPFLLHLLYGNEFIGAVQVLRILVIEVVLSSTVWVLAQAFMAAGRPGIVTLLQGVGLGFSVPLMWVLIPPYGLEGAGFALLISTIARLLFILINFPMVLKVPPPSLIMTRQDYALMRSTLAKKL
jgi:enterobacterial common antigen flippase